LEHPGLDKAAGEEFLQEAFRILLEEGVRKGTDAAEKVCEWKEPRELRELLDLELRRRGEPPHRVLERCRDVLRYSVKTGEAGGPILSCPILFYPIHPIPVIPPDPILPSYPPGHPIASYPIPSHPIPSHPIPSIPYTLSYPILSSVKTSERRWPYPTPSHPIHSTLSYPTQREDLGKMLPAELEKEIEKAKAEGSVPFFVSATSGTTVLGAFDPLPGIAAVCRRHGLWLHVDAAWGGSALLSRKHRHLLDGIEGADSVAWNPHKMLTVGLQCSAFLLRDGSGLLQRCHGAGATYLFQRDKFYDVSYDTGDKSVQCGRRVDCLKLWLLWKAVGTDGLERRVDRAFSCTRYLAEELKKREGFQLVLEPEFVNLCFWFVPPSLRGREGAADYGSRLGKVAPAIKERMMRSGSMMVGYQPHGARANFFRQVVTNPAVTRADLDFFLDEIERLGRDL
ncbi:CSAD decarboxylase, partial [Crypturellus soui]|nr:CSAD decarboxylase [Crypturellus soui]